jgi:hypothetical protein
MRETVASAFLHRDVQDSTISVEDPSSATVVGPPGGFGPSIANRQS